MQLLAARLRGAWRHALCAAAAVAPTPAWAAAPHVTPRMRRRPAAAAAAAVGARWLSQATAGYLRPRAMLLPPRLWQPGRPPPLRAHLATGGLTVNTATLAKGRMALVQRADSSMLVVLSRTDGTQRWWGLDKDGSQHVFAAADVQYVVDDRSDYAWAEIAGVERAAAAHTCTADTVRAAWELARESAQPLGVAELCELMLGTATPSAMLAAAAALHRDRVYFSPAGAGRLRPNSAEQDFVAAYTRAAAQPHGRKPPRDSWEARRQWREWVAALEETALTPDQPTSVPVLQSLGLPVAQPGFASAQALVTMGWWTYHHNVPLLRARVPVSFTPAQLELAAAVAAAPGADPDAAGRVDLTRLKAVTIDPPGAVEIDDAISVEELPGGRWRIWVHVADPTRYLPLGHALEEEALRRSSTLYLPTGTVPMIPPALSTGPMSLTQGVDCCALTVMAEVEGDGSVAHAEVMPSTVRVTYGLTYAGADELLALGLDEERDLKLLEAFCAARLAYRRRGGAVTVEMPQTSVSVTGADVLGGGPDAQVTVALDGSRGTSASAAIVQEAMVLAGEVVARMGADNGLLLPYRSQQLVAPPSEDWLADVPEGPCRAVAQRSRMPAGVQGLTPAPHGGLGLQAYVQCTSPIRRYSDMLAHYALKAHARGQPPPLPRQELEERVEKSGAMAREVARLQRESERYWITHWFSQQPLDRVYPALLLRWLKAEAGVVSALLEELGLELPVRLSRDARVGERLALELVLARPREGVLHFRERLGGASRSNAALYGLR